jgi:hypothetical protein
MARAGAGAWRWHVYLPRTVVLNELFSSSCCIRVLVRLSASVTLLDARSNDSSWLAKVSVCESVSFAHSVMHWLEPIQYPLLPRGKSSYCSGFAPARVENNSSLSRLAWTSERFLESIRAFLELACSLLADHVKNVYAGGKRDQPWIRTPWAAFHPDYIYPKLFFEMTVRPVHQPAAANTLVKRELVR